MYRCVCMCTGVCVHVLVYRCECMHACYCMYRYVFEHSTSA